MLKLGFAWPVRIRTKALLYYLAVIGTPCAFFLWRLGGQTPGLSAGEAILRSSAKLSNIIHAPINLPYKLVDNALYHSGLPHVVALRLGSVLFGLLFVTLFFYVLKGWFGKPIALLTALLFALTPLYLLSSRTATANIMQTSTILILAAYYYFWHSQNMRLALAAIIVGLVVCLYAPGLVWLLVLGAIFLRDKFSAVIRNLERRNKVTVCLIILAALAPLLYGFILHHYLIKDWLLIPHSLPSIADCLKNLVWGLSSLFLASGHVSDLSVGRLPVLDAAQIGLLIFGAYVVYARLRIIFYWISSSVLLILILFGLNGRYELLLAALPFLAFLSGMGLRYLYIEWRKVFPRNPLAKAFAIIFMRAVVGMHTFYGIRYSLIAWPATPNVRQVYVLK
jgi:hypothetical protein